MKNLFILLFVALMATMMGVFNQLYLLSNEENPLYLYGAVISGSIVLFLLIYAYADYRKDEP